MSAGPGRAVKQKASYTNHSCLWPSWKYTEQTEILCLSNKIWNFSKSIKYRRVHIIMMASGILWLCRREVDWLTTEDMFEVLVGDRMLE